MQTHRTNSTKFKIIPISLTALALIAIFVCMICDLAISGKFTWSLIVISSVMFAWLLLMSLTVAGKRGISQSLIILSLLLIPYLYILSILLQEHLIFAIGLATSIASIIYLWCVFAIFYVLPSHKFRATGIALLLSILLYFVVKIILFQTISEPIIEIEDIVDLFILIFLAATMFICDYYKRKNQP